MKLAVGRLIVTAALFAGWLGYLGYLVVCRPHTPDGLRGAFEGHTLTLSQPQIMVSMLDVIARVDDEKGENVIVEQVLYPAENAPVKPGDKIEVVNIDRCRPMPDPVAKDREPPPDWSGPGSYLLPLQFGPNKDRFEVVPTPSSPGYPPGYIGGVGHPRIYPPTPELLAEYSKISKAK
jgi:hypothetical protein